MSKLEGAADGFEAAQVGGFLLPRYICEERVKAK